MSPDLLTLQSLVAAESPEGRELARDLTRNPICSLSIDEEVPCVAVVWKRYATSNQLRLVHEHILRLLTERGLSKILGDDTLIPTIHEADQAWIAVDWMPRALAAGLKVVAAKSPRFYFGKASVADIQSVAPRELQIRSFEDLRRARLWLKGEG